jgi:hypothetical protein
VNAASAPVSVSKPRLDVVPNEKVAVPPFSVREPKSAVSRKATVNEASPPVSVSTPGDALSPSAKVAEPPVSVRVPGEAVRVVFEPLSAAAVSSASPTAALRNRSSSVVWPGLSIRTLRPTSPIRAVRSGERALLAPTRKSTSSPDKRIHRRAEHVSAPRFVRHDEMCIGVVR